LAALQSGGFRRFFGTASKAYMAGRVAETGVAAARAAAHGSDAPADVFEGPNGFLALYRPDARLDLAPLDALGQVWSLVTPGVAVKPWPVCSCASAVIEAVVELRADLGFAPDEIATIDARVTPMVADALVFDRPSEPLHLLFSLPYAAALAATHGTVTPRDIAEATLADPALAELAARVSHRVDPVIGDPTRAPEACAVEITLTDGRRAARSVDVALGDPTRPLPDAAFRAKLEACVADMPDPPAVAAALAAVDSPSGLSRLLSLRAPRAEP
jgi:2-methylcitrate dehydratase PrpD